MKLTGTAPGTLALRQAQDEGYWKPCAYFKREMRMHEHMPYVVLPLF